MLVSVEQTSIVIQFCKTKHEKVQRAWSLLSALSAFYYVWNIAPSVAFIVKDKCGLFINEI